MIKITIVIRDRQKLKKDWFDMNPDFLQHLTSIGSNEEDFR